MKEILDKEVMELIGSDCRGWKRYCKLEEFDIFRAIGTGKLQNAFS